MLVSGRNLEVHRVPPLSMGQKHLKFDVSSAEYILFATGRMLDLERCTFCPEKEMANTRINAEGDEQLARQAEDWGEDRLIINDHVQRTT